MCVVVGGGVVMEFVLSLRTKSLHQSRPLEVMPC